MNLSKIDAHKIRWVLGSDIGAGPFLSMIDVINSFTDQHKKEKLKASYMRAIFRSTLASAKVLGISNEHGNFAKGKEASFLSIKLKNNLASASHQIDSDQELHSWLKEVLKVPEYKR
ncbi:amidohydrolase family protein, partial [Bacteriovoracaceae bacterium]|nr:amidohydrolase family protein [Bacteriovoracaceae bacterium]